ncbi:MAG TPA: dihydrolipoamide acetyltransferase family protein [Geobacteraceae bacterium]
MPFEFTLPDLGEGIAEVELRRWRVGEGERVAEHQPLVEVETDKAVVEVPSPRSGRVERLLHREGETVAVGAVLLTIATEGEAPRERPRSVGIVGELPEAQEEATGEPAAAVLATPAVRKRARERGIELGAIRGSGPRGSITPDDLERAAAQAEAPAGPASGPVERLPLRGMRRTIARHVLASQRQTAAVTAMEEVDVTELWELRNREQHEVESHGGHLTFLPFFIKAAQHALREHPYLNAAVDDAAEEIVVKRHYHFGIAVETTDGLMVPASNPGNKQSWYS